MLPVTIKKIAVAAKTDTGTVSRVLSGDYRKARISEGRAQHIKAVAQRLNWRPNVAARTTRTGRFSSIALVSSTRLGLGHYQSPRFVNSVHDAAQAHKYLLHYVRLSPEQVDGAERARLLEETCVDGWLLNFNTLLPQTLEEQIESLRVPVVRINCWADQNVVRPNDQDAATRLTQLLLRAGCRRIAYYDSEWGQDVLAMGGIHYSVPHRQAGYELAMRAAGLEPRVIRPAVAVPRRDCMAYAMREVDFCALDAVVTYNPAEAQSLMLLSERAGRRVPEDLLVATFHESPLGAAGLPIVTASMRWDLLATTAVRMLMDRIEDVQESQAAEEIRYEMDVPEAVAALHAGLAKGTV